MTLVAIALRVREGPAAALEVLEPHLARGPQVSGVFPAEAAVALCAFGRRAEAKAQLEQGIKNFPHTEPMLREIGAHLKLFPREP